MTRNDKTSILSCHILLVHKNPKLRFFSADIFVDRIKNDINFRQQGNGEKLSESVLSLPQICVCPNLNSEFLAHVRPFQLFSPAS